jgi:hypothetical protein
VAPPSPSKQAPLQGSDSATDSFSSAIGDNSSPRSANRGLTAGVVANRFRPLSTGRSSCRFRTPRLEHFGTKRCRPQPRCASHNRIALISRVYGTGGKTTVFAVVLCGSERQGPAGPRRRFVLRMGSPVMGAHAEVLRRLVGAVPKSGPTVRLSGRAKNADD